MVHKTLSHFSRVFTLGSATCRQILRYFAVRALRNAINMINAFAQHSEPIKFLLGNKSQYLLQGSMWHL